MRLASNVLMLSASLLLLNLAAETAHAQSNPVDYAIKLTTEVASSPLSISMHWPRDSNAQSWNVSRRTDPANSFESLATLNAADTFFIDKAIERGIPYEYSITKTAKSGAKSYKAYSYTISGVDVPAIHDRGKVLLLVDNRFAASLAPEIARLSADLVGDGFSVVQTEVAPTATPAEVKSWIYSEYIKDPENAKYIFLLGHVPVPYSGDIAPDGHVPGKGNHQGAWPADVYYSDMSGEWTDTKVNDVTAGDPRNRNIPGDGKFDQNYIPGFADMAIGRVDFANMPAFPMSEEALLKKYLDKDHNFRTGVLTAPDRALIDDNFRIIVADIDIPSSSAWRNYPALMPVDSIRELDWFSTLSTEPYLFAYGDGAGSFTSCSGIGTTNDFATQGSKSIFNMLFGSFFGDWDSENNILRAPLATDYGLTSCWAGRPYWLLFHMGMGGTIGQDAQLTQNAIGEYFLCFGAQGFNVQAMGNIHVALLGDPTLRMSYPAPATPITAEVSSNHVNLSWSGMSNAYVYRSAKANGPFKSLSDSPVTTGAFIDVAPLADTNYYMVRPRSKTITASGSYYDLGKGSFAMVRVSQTGVAAIGNAALRLSAKFLANGSLSVTTNTERNLPRLSLTDITGKTIGRWGENIAASAEFDLPGLAHGAYFLTADSGENIKLIW